MAATKPDNREVTLTYPKGSVSACLGLIKYLFPSVKFAWKTPTGTTPRGRRRSFNYKRRSPSDAGEPLRIMMKDGTSWWVRITGTPQDFIRALFAETDDDRFTGIYTQRGTNFLPEVELDKNGILPD